MIAPADPAGERFDPGHGRTMWEWISVTSASTIS